LVVHWYTAAESMVCLNLFAPDVETTFVLRIRQASQAGGPRSFFCDVVTESFGGALPLLCPGSCGSNARKDWLIVQMLYHRLD
jgi:hypothetical protein